ncbi:hypothetical protein CIB84_002003 [Bambusicola thoracicus]|uniref:Uncharacterized protein n=1 Tax=Bambusicola thoracicus TaxID=9083 RepID=A0A2P4TCZ1_BAMTH|nr:hypothetical protein CIB84_002003 [Bambusicola thoracicus]
MLRFLWDSISLQMLFVFLLVFLLVFDYMKRRKPKDFPPSPFSFPFLGNVQFMFAKDPLAATQKLYNAFPSIIKYLPGSHQTIFKNWRLMKDFVNEKISKHKEDLNPSESRDFIDSYLQEMAKPDGREFHEENLVACALDLLFAGTETTSTTIRWALLFMAVYPEIQARVQAEIDAVIGQSRQPALEDRNNMPYTNAVIHEVQRKGNIIPFNVPRQAVKDTVLAGFHVPKGTVLVPNLSSVMYDEKEWETPHSFNPGHFLKDGQFWKREAFMPFSIGKRACLGELLARAELFLFFTSLLQKFTFQAPPDTILDFKFTMGITLAPRPYKICAVPRSDLRCIIEEHGDIVSMQVRSQSFVILNGLQMIKEALVTQGENSMNRLEIPMNAEVFNKLGNPFNPHLKINNAFSNVICSITFGNWFEYHDENFQTLLWLMDETVSLYGKIMSQVTLTLDFLKPDGSDFCEDNMVSATLVFDKKEWETPHSFNPGHFLKDSQFWKREAFMPFSIALLQKFTFQAPLDTILDLKFKLEMTLAPLPYKICAVPRSQMIARGNQLDKEAELRASHLQFFAARQQYPVRIKDSLFGFGEFNILKIGFP